MKKSAIMFLLVVGSVFLVGGCAKSPNGEDRQETVKRETYEEKVDQLAEARDRVQELQGELQNLKQSLENQSERVEQLEEKKEQLQELRRKNEQLQESLSELKDVQTRREGQNVVLTVGTDILFDLGEYRLKPQAKQKIDRLAKIIARNEDRPVVVEGHSDTVPVISESRFPSNRLLSAARAANVVKYLTEEHDLEPARFFAGGYGEHDPVVPNTSPENRAKNRRVEIVFLPPDLEEKPMESTSSDTD